MEYGTTHDPATGIAPEPPDAPGGLETVTGLKFRPAVFDVYGGCSEDTAQLFMDYAERVAC